MGTTVDNSSSVLHARKGDIKSSTQISFDNALVKSLDTITSFSGVTFTSSDLNKHYLYLGNESGYINNGIYKIILSNEVYVPQLDLDLAKILDNASDISDLQNVLSGLTISSSYTDSTIYELHTLLTQIIGRLGGGQSTPATITGLTTARMKDVYYEYKAAVAGDPVDSVIPLNLYPFVNNTFTPVDGASYSIGSTSIGASIISNTVRDLWLVLDCTALTNNPNLSWDSTVFKPMDKDNNNLVPIKGAYNVFMISEYRSGKFMVAKKLFEEVSS